MSHSPVSRFGNRIRDRGGYDTALGDVDASGLWQQRPNSATGDVVFLMKADVQWGIGALHEVR